VLHRLGEAEVDPEGERGQQLRQPDVSAIDIAGDGASLTRGARVPSPDMAIEHDEQLWGGETAKAIENFQVSGIPVRLEVVHWLARIKGAAARVNADLGKLDPGVAQRIAEAADRVAAGEFDDQFPIDAFQTGSGTSTNMNANEVIASLAGDEAHPNDHVNMGQSSNDVFPSAVHLAALDEVTNDLLPALDELEGALAAKAREFVDIVKSGRTHLMDAVPVTLGQEFGGYAAQVRLGAERIRATLPHVAQIPLGGTATGTGLNTHPQFAERVRTLLAEQANFEVRAPEDPFEAQGNRDALVELSGALKVLAVSMNKVANDIAWMGSGPRAGLGELLLPELQKGSSIMPGKVNPVIPEVVMQVAAQVIGNDTAITFAGSQGNFELNVRIPLIARNLLESIQLLSAKCRLFATKCIEGIEPNLEGTQRSAESTLAVATALNPYIGYDKAAEIVKDASASGRTLREVAREHGVDEETLDKALDLRKIAAGSSATD
jgi:fumarate hydratase class II